MSIIYSVFILAVWNAIYRGPYNRAGAWARGAGDLLTTHNRHASSDAASTSAPVPVTGPLSCQQVSELRSGARKAALALGPLPSSLDLARPSTSSQPATPSFPLLLVRRSYAPAERRGHGALASGWSLILPAGWVMPVWSALAFKGTKRASGSHVVTFSRLNASATSAGLHPASASVTLINHPLAPPIRGPHLCYRLLPSVTLCYPLLSTTHWLLPSGARPCGQQEWRWVAALAQAPCFPYDFPHTAAGAAWLDGVRRRDLAAASRRPLGRARRVPAAAYAAWATGLGREMSVAAPLDHSRVVIEDEIVLLPRPMGGKGGSIARGGGKGGGPGASDCTATDSTAASSAVHLVVSLGGAQAGTIARPSVLNNDAGSSVAQPMTSSGGTGPGGRLTRVEAKCRRLLERALRATSGGLAAGSPGTALTPAVPRLDASLPARSVGAAQRSGETVPHPGLMAYVSVHIRGRGRCEEGAAVIMSSSLLLVSSAPSEPTQGPVTGPGAAAVAAVPPRAAAPPAAAGPLRVIGYITSGYPRGMPGSLYPGGTALCIASCLEAEVTSAASASAKTRLECWVLNPDSNVLRRAEIHLNPACRREAVVITM